MFDLDDAIFLEMDIKVRDTLKVLEEDADNFAKRAAMVYKKRPELVNLVEGFYKLYHSLVDQYDYISNELQHAECNTDDVFWNQTQHTMDFVSSRPSQNKKKDGKQYKESKTYLKEKGHDLSYSMQVVNVSSYTEEIRREIVSTKVSNHSYQMYKMSGADGSPETEKETELQKELFKAQQEIEMLKRDCTRGGEQFRIVEEEMMKFQDKLQDAEEENSKLKKDSASYVARIAQLEEQVSMLKEAGQQVDKDQLSKLLPAIREKDSSGFEIQNMQMNAPVTRQTTQTSMLHEYSTPVLTNREMQDGFFNYHHENGNLRMQVMTQFPQLQGNNEEIQNLQQAFFMSHTEKDLTAQRFQQYFKSYEIPANEPDDVALRMTLRAGNDTNVKDDTAGKTLSVHSVEKSTKDLELALQGDTFHGDIFLNNYRQFLSKAKDHQNFVSAELVARNEKLDVAAGQIKYLEKEIERLQEENGCLTAKSSSALLSVKNLEQEVSKLKQLNDQLLHEVSFRVDQRDALQQELYCLKEERNNLDRRYQAIMKHIRSFGLNAENFHVVYGRLQDISLKLKDLIQTSDCDRINIFQILQKLEQLLLTNKNLENSMLFHQSEASKYENETKVLKEWVENLRKENSELMDRSDEFKGQIRILESKLRGIYTANHELQEDNKRLSEKLGDTVEQMKQLEDQNRSLLEEKAELQNKVEESKLITCDFEKQVAELKLVEQELQGMLEEETSKAKALLSEKENEVLSETNKKNDLEAKICRLQKLLTLPDQKGEITKDDYAETLDNHLDSIDSLKNIYQKVKCYQSELSDTRDQIRRHQEDLSSKDAHINQLKQDIRILSLEKQSNEEAIAVGLKKLSLLKNEIGRYEEKIKLLETELEEGAKQERNLRSELNSLQESLTSSEAARSDLEDQCKSILEKYQLAASRLHEYENMIFHLELENSNLLIESLAQTSLVVLLENTLLERDEEKQFLNNKLLVLQGAIQHIENRQHCAGTKTDMQEVESQQLAESLCGSHEEEQQTDEDRELSLALDQYPIYKAERSYEKGNRSGEHDLQKPKGKEPEELQAFQDIKEYELMFEGTDAERKSSGYMILEFHKDENSYRDVQSGSTEIEEAKSDIQEVSSNAAKGDYARYLEEQIRELKTIVRNMQIENSRLKVQKKKADAVGDITRGTEKRHYGKAHSSKSLSVERTMNPHEEKEVIVQEAESGRNMGDKLKRENYLLQEQNQKPGAKFDSTNGQLNKLQRALEGLHEKFSKLSQQCKHAKDQTSLATENSLLAKQLSDLHKELLFWLELNDLLKTEVQYRFASLGRFQEEITGIGPEGREENFVMPASALQRDILVMQEENKKLADVLQGGADRARGLEFEVENCLSKLREDIAQNSRRSGPDRLRIPLRTFLFGKKDQSKKKISWSCTSPRTNE
eukprot:TRINITY_DN37685_c0_g1_i1.p1 TRINITY_DN37685_c0_g1~~TRINITY_DN37685_c0_g1_i1.p1  ORF type:complete len:1420 (-),score=315.54 TRINITY_DN37685_c0_g1_i1:392-4651(-)